MTCYDYSKYWAIAPLWANYFAVQPVSGELFAFQNDPLREFAEHGKIEKIASGLTPPVGGPSTWCMPEAERDLNVLADRLPPSQWPEDAPLGDLRPALVLGEYAFRCGSSSGLRFSREKYLERRKLRANEGDRLSELPEVGAICRHPAGRGFVRTGPDCDGFVLVEWHGKYALVEHALCVPCPWIAEELSNDV